MLPISYNMGMNALPDIHARSRRTEDMHIRQSTHTHVITIRCSLLISPFSCDLQQMQFNYSRYLQFFNPYIVFEVTKFCQNTHALR